MHNHYKQILFAERVDALRTSAFLEARKENWVHNMETKLKEASLLSDINDCPEAMLSTSS